jgi:hypothetical protein
MFLFCQALIWNYFCIGVFKRWLTNQISVLLLGFNSAITAYSGGFMEIEEVGGHASLNWNGTRTKLHVVKIDGKIVFKGDSSMIEGDHDYFVKISDLAVLEQVMNILSMVED